MTAAPDKKPPLRSKHAWRRSAPESRTEILELDFSDEEMALIAARAADADMSLDDYIVVCLVGAEGNA